MAELVIVDHGNPEGGDLTQKACEESGVGIRKDWAELLKISKAKTGGRVSQTEKYHVGRGGVKVYGKLTHHLFWKLDRDILAF